MTQQQFNDKWKDLHSYFDVQSELLFYYALYVKLQGMLKYAQDETLLDMLLYVEEMAQMALCVDYGEIYRCVEDLPTLWMNDLYIDEDVQEVVNDLLRERIEDAPKGALSDWMRSSVMSGDFHALKTVALWFHYNDPALKRLQCLPDARCTIYGDLFSGNFIELQKWVQSDYALNWRDKTGKTVFERMAFWYGFKKDAEMANRLNSIEPLSVNCYYADKVDGTQVTLRTRSGRVLENVEFFTNVECDWQSMCCVCMVTGYNGKWYVNGPCIWHDKDSMDRWPGTQAFLDAVDEEDRRIVKGESFCNTWGEECSLYKDFYDDEDDEADDKEYDEADFFAMFEGLRSSGVLDKFKELLSTREGAERVLRGLGIPPEIADLDHNPHYMNRAQRRKMEGVKVPDYKYLPTDMDAETWFDTNIGNVRDWTIIDSTDLLYALRVYEGWMKQAHTYYTALNYEYAYFIASDVLPEAVNFFEDHQSDEDYKKYHNRIKKVVRDSYELTMQTVPHDPSNWREELMKFFEGMKEEHEDDPYTIFNTNAPFSIDETIERLHAMMK